MAGRVWLAQLSRHVPLVEQAELIAGLGVWQWRPEPDELSWSDNLFRLFGLEPGGIRPSPSFVLERVDRADRATVENALAALRRGEMPEVEYTCWLKDGTARDLRCTTTLTEKGSGGQATVAGWVVDLSQRHQIERRLVLWQVVTEALDEWESFEMGAERLLAAIGTATRGCFGTLWSFEDAVFGARATWHSPSPELDRVATATRGWQPGIGAPTIGAAFATALSDGLHGCHGEHVGGPGSGTAQRGDSLVGRHSRGERWSDPGGP